MDLLFGAVAVVFVSSLVVSLASPFLGASHQGAHFAVRLRYLALGVLFLGLGVYLMANGIVRWIDWGSLLVGLFAFAMGGAYLYACGGIGPGNRLP